MKHHRLLLTIATFIITASGTAGASEIYKSTDADGNVYYQDRPTGADTEQRMHLVSARTDNAAVLAQTEARLEAKAAAEQVASEAPAEMSWQELKAEKEKRQQQCQMYRDRLDLFLRSRQLYRDGEDGERTYLDETETLAARERVEGQIREYCGA